MPSSAQILHGRQLYAQYIGDTVLTNVAGAPTLSAPLVLGAKYLLLCPDTDVYLRQGGAGTIVDVKQFPLDQGLFRELTVDDVTNNKLSVMTATGVGGTLRATRVDAPRGAAGPPGSLALHQATYFLKYIGSSVDIAIGAASVRSAALVLGARYDMVCEGVDIYVAQGDVTVVADNTVLYLPQGEVFTFNVDATVNPAPAINYIAALTAEPGGVGTLRITRRDDWH